MDYLYDPDALYHHGVLGMKWGVHRYKSAGGLTAKGQQRFNAVASNERLAKRDTKRALKVLQSNHRSSVSAVNKNLNKALAFEKKNKLIGIKQDPTKLSNNQKKIDKLNSKLAKNDQRKYAYTDAAKANKLLANYYADKIRDIQYGKSKAGRDFIVQRDYDVYPFVVPTGAGVVPGVYAKRTDKIIERN